jgi:hypothetical protein
VTEPQQLSTPFARTCQAHTAFLQFICQRTMEIMRHYCVWPQTRNPGRQAVTCGSRKRVHNIRGSVKSIGLSTP